MSNKFQTPKPAKSLGTTAPKDVIPNPIDIPAGVGPFHGDAHAFVSSKGKAGLAALSPKSGIIAGDAIANLHYVASNSQLSQEQKVKAVAYLLNLWYQRGGARPAQAQAASEPAKQASGIQDFQQEHRKISGGGGTADFQAQAAQL